MAHFHEKYEIIDMLENKYPDCTRNYNCNKYWIAFSILVIQ